MTTRTNVPVKSAWASKINWTQAVAFLAMLAAAFGIDMDEGTQTAVVSSILAIQALVTWIMRTWFTKSITPSSSN